MFGGVMLGNVAVFWADNFRCVVCLSLRLVNCFMVFAVSFFFVVVLSL